MPTPEEKRLIEHAWATGRLSEENWSLFLEDVQNEPDPNTAVKNALDMSLGRRFARSFEKRRDILSDPKRMGRLANEFVEEHGGYLGAGAEILKSTVTSIPLIASDAASLATGGGFGRDPLEKIISAAQLIPYGRMVGGLAGVGLRAAGQRALATGVGKAVTKAPVVWASRAAEVADVAGSENPIIEAAGEGTFEIASSVAGRTAMRSRESTLRKDRETQGVAEVHPETGEEVRTKKDRERGRRRRTYLFGDGGTATVERTGMLNESWRVTMELGQDTKTFNFDSQKDVRGFESAFRKASEFALGEETDVTDETTGEGTAGVEQTDEAAGVPTEQPGAVETPPDVDESGAAEVEETDAGADTQEEVAPPPEETVTPETEVASDPAAILDAVATELAETLPDGVYAGGINHAINRWQDRLDRSDPRLRDLRYDDIHNAIVEKLNERVQAGAETEEGQEVTDEVTTAEETVTDEEAPPVGTEGDAEVPTGSEDAAPPGTAEETGDSASVPPVDTPAEDTVAELDRILEESGKSLEEVLADHQRARQVLLDYADDMTPEIQAGIDQIDARITELEGRINAEQQETVDTADETVQPGSEGVPDETVETTDPEVMAARSGDGSGDAIHINAPTAEGRLAAALISRLGSGQSITDFREFYALADEAWGDTRENGAYTEKQAYNVMEAAANWVIRERLQTVLGGSIDMNMNTLNDTIQQISEGLESLLPRQSVRDQATQQTQQFSTPFSYGLALNWIANIKPADVILEPSAGTGNLAIYGSAINADVVVNEIDPHRAEMLRLLGFEPHQLDATQIDNLLPTSINPTVVVMNPPFSMDLGRRDLSTGGDHILQALRRLRPNGRLVAIVGGGINRADSAPAGMATTSRTYASFFEQVRDMGHLRANIHVDGSVYSRFGTNFDTRVLVIDKVEGDAPAPIEGSAENLHALVRLLRDIRNERPEIDYTDEQDTPVEPGVRPTPPVTTTTVTAPTTPTEGDDAGDLGGGEPTPRRQPVAADPGGTPPGGDEVDTETTDELLPPSEGGQPTVGTPDEPTGSGGRATSSTGGGRATTTKPGQRAGGGSIESVAGELTRDEAASTFRQWNPQAASMPENAQPHPGRLDETGAMADVQAPEMTYVPNLPPEIIESGAVSESQLEAVIQAGQAHQTEITGVYTGEELQDMGIENPSDAPQTLRGGAFNGDSTGVGKGRTAAAVILDNYRQGRKKAVWLSASGELYADAQRDIRGIGDDANRSFSLGKAFKINDKINLSEGTLFTTYATLRSANQGGTRSRLDQIIEWLGPDFDGVIIFDEVHAMNNAMSYLDATGRHQASKTAVAGLTLETKLPNARVLYMSATGATEVRHITFANRIGLWGPGTAFENKRQFVDEIVRGGIAAMEVVARDMKARGKYIRRQLSFEDVEYSDLVHDYTPDQIRVHDKFAELWRRVFGSMGTIIENLNMPPAYAASAFYGSQQRFFNQLFIIQKMPTLLQDIESQVNAGNAAVIQITATMEAALNRALANAAIEHAVAQGEATPEMESRTLEADEWSDLETAGQRGARSGEIDIQDMTVTPKDILKRFLEQTFPIFAHRIVMDENGNQVSEMIIGQDGRPLVDRRALEERNRFLAEVDALPLGGGALDQLLDRFGIANIAEVTRRGQRLVFDRAGERTLQPRSGSNQGEIDSFMDDKKKIIVFSKAGGTGASYHADNERTNKRQRIHYVVDVGWSAKDAIQGLGRSHRSNQAQAPKIVLVRSNNDGERRFFSTISRRLDQVGALTAGDRGAASGGLMRAEDNLETAYGKTALQNMLTMIHTGELDIQVPGARGDVGLTIDHLEEMLSLSVKDEEGNFSASQVPEVTQFLNRILALPFSWIGILFNAYMEQLQSVLDFHRQNNTLDVGTETIPSQSAESISQQVVHTDPTSGAESVLETILTTVPTQKNTLDDTLGKQGLRRFVEGAQGGLYAEFTAPNRIARDGTQTPQVRWVSANQSRLIEQAAADRSATNLGTVANQSIMDRWSAEYDSTPDTKQENLYMLTGAILPIWDRMPEDASVKVRRVFLDDGTTRLGRVIDESDVQELSNNLGIVIDETGTVTRQRDWTANETYAAVVEQGERLSLANGWELKQSTIMNADWLEIVGPIDTDFEFMENLGVEIRSVGGTRFLIPVGTQGRPILNALIGRHRVTGVAQAGPQRATLAPPPQETPQETTETPPEGSTPPVTPPTTPVAQSGSGMTVETRPVDVTPGISGQVTVISPGSQQQGNSTMGRFYERQEGEPDSTIGQFFQRQTEQEQPPAQETPAPEAPAETATEELPEISDEAARRFVTFQLHRGGRNAKLPTQEGMPQAIEQAKQLLGRVKAIPRERRRQITLPSNWTRDGNKGIFHLIIDGDRAGHAEITKERAVFSIPELPNPEITYNVRGPNHTERFNTGLNELASQLSLPENMEGENINRVEEPTAEEQALGARTTEVTPGGIRITKGMFIPQPTEQDRRRIEAEATGVDQPAPEPTVEETPESTAPEPDIGVEIDEHPAFQDDENVNLAMHELQQLEERIQAGEVSGDYSLSDDIAVASYKNRRAVGYYDIEMTPSREVMSTIFTEFFPRGVRNNQALGSSQERFASLIQNYISGVSGLGTPEQTTMVDNPSRAEMIENAWRMTDSNRIDEDTGLLRDVAPAEQGSPKRERATLRQKIRRFISGVQNTQPDVAQGAVRVYQDVVVDRQQYDFMGEVVASAEELAVLAQVYRNPAIESSRVFYLDDAGKILGHAGYSLNKMSSTRTASHNHIRRQAEKLNATNVAFLHNHPSTEARHSEADLRGAREQSSELGDLYAYDVIINSGTYAYTQRTADGVVEYVDSVELDREGLGWQRTLTGYKDPLLERDETLTSQHTATFDEHLTMINEQFRVGKQSELAQLGLRYKSPRNWSTFAVLRSNGTLAGIAEYKSLHHLSRSEFSDFVDGVVQHFDGDRVNIYFSEGDWYSSQAEGADKIRSTYAKSNDKIDSVWLDLEMVNRTPGQGYTDAGRFEETEAVFPEGTQIPWSRWRELIDSTLLSDVAARVKEVAPEASVVLPKTAVSTEGGGGRGGGKGLDKLMRTLHNHEGVIAKKLEAWTPQLRQRFLEAKSELFSGIAALDSMGEPGTELKTAFSRRVHLTKYLENQFQRSFYGTKTKPGPVPEFEKLSRAKFKEAQGKGTEEAFRTFQLALEEQVWQFVEGNEDISDVDLKAVAVQWKETWREMVRSNIHLMINLKKSMESEGQSLDIVDSDRKRTKWRPIMPGYGWSEERNQFTTGRGKNIKYHDIDAVMDRADEIWTPHFYPASHWESKVEAMDRRRAILDDLDDEATEIPGFRYFDQEKAWQWMEGAEGKSRPRFTDRAEAIAYARMQAVYSRNIAKKQQDALQQGDSREGHMERKRETQDEFYTRRLGIMVDMQMRFADRAGELTFFGQYDPNQGKWGGSPILRGYLRRVRRYAADAQEEAIREFTAPLLTYEKFADMKGFSLSEQGEALSALRRWAKDGGIDPDRIFEDNPGINDDMKATLVRIGLLRQKEDGTFEMQSQTATARILGEYFDTVSLRETTALKIFNGLHGKENFDPIEVQGMGFWKFVNDATTIATLGPTASIQNIAEMPIMTMMTGSKAMMKATAKFISDPDFREAGNFLGASIGQTKAYLADGGQHTSRWLDWIRFNQTDKIGRGIGVLAGVERIKDDIRAYVGQQTDINAQRLEDNGVSRATVDDYIKDNGTVERLDSIFSEFDERYRSGLMPVEGVRLRGGSGAADSYTDILGDEISRGAAFISDASFKQYNRLSLNSPLASRDPKIRVFLKYQAWAFQQSAHVLRMTKRAFARAAQGDFRSIGWLVTTMGSLTGGYIAMRWVYDILQGRDDDKDWRERAIDGFAEAQAAGYISMILEVARRAEGSAYEAMHSIMFYLSPPVGTVIGRIGAETLTEGPVAGAKAAVKQLPGGREVRRFFGFTLPEEWR